MGNRLTALATALATELILVHASTARASVMYGTTNDDPSVSGSEKLVRIDPATGTATVVGTMTGVANPQDLASDPRPASFRLWTVDVNTNQLLSVNPDTGATTVIGTMSNAANQVVSAVAFDATTETLFGLGQQFRTLFAIDPNTAAVTSRGNVDTTATLIALGTDATGRLFTASSGGQLLELNKANGSSTLRGNMVTAMTDLASRPEDGVMYGVSLTTDSVYTIDTSNGSTTLVGPHGAGITQMVGLAFSPIPEPAVVTLTLAATACAFQRRRRAPRGAESRS